MVDARTVELYSKQGNTDITELIVIGERTQCEIYEERNAKGTSFRTRRVILQELSAERTKSLKETTAQGMIRYSGVKWQTRTRALIKHFSQTAKEYLGAKHHFRIAFRNNFEGCADRWNKDADYRKCVQETAARTKPWKVGTKSRVDIGRLTKRRRSKGRRNLRTSGMLFKLPLDPTRYQRM